MDSDEDQDLKAEYARQLWEENRMRINALRRASVNSATEEPPEYIEEDEE